MELDSSQLVIGERVKLQAGDRVPADMWLIYAEDLFVSQSVITGESAISKKTIAPLSGVPQTLSDYSNILFGGTTVTGGKGTGIVLAVGEETVYGNAAVPIPLRGRSSALCW